MMKPLMIAALLASGLTVSTGAAFAQMSNINQTAPTGRAEGEVRKIDKAAGEITLKHGPIKDMGMSGMTMAFPVADPTLLDKVKVGDKVSFTVAMKNSQMVVQSVEPRK
ncbi:copper-binding protein [Ferrovibrio sp.]|uniref:copper-binding protein n=1 Tax=Ferrovibrio sp. TaxID=1917215 RepID=UPI00260D7D9F|nr:copper-binding protein [Ferrovibrio sp.]